MTPASTLFIEPITTGLNWTELVAAYKRYLQPFGVDWVGESQEPGLWLLHRNMGRGVSQEKLTRFYYETFNMDYNKQLRHIAALGWHIASGSKRATRMPYDKQLARDELMLVSVTAPNPVWSNQKRLTRMGHIGVASWEERLLQYASHGCAVCGQKFDHYDRGHLDSTKKFELENLVPMCVKCNNWAQAHNVDFELDGLIARGFRRSS